MTKTPGQLLLLVALASALFLGFQNCGDIKVARGSALESLGCSDDNAYEISANYNQNTVQVEFILLEKNLSVSREYLDSQLLWSVNEVAAVGPKPIVLLQSPANCERITVNVQFKNKCGASLTRETLYRDPRCRIVTPPPIDPPPPPPPTPTPPPFVLPAGFQCLDSPLHTIMASEQYAQISSTSTSLLDRRQYFATRLKGNSMIWTVKIIVDAGDSTVSKAAAWFEVGQGYGSGPAPRIVTLSKNKCDTSETNNIVISGAARPSNNSTFEFSLNEPTRAGISGLTTGVYYLNIQNVDCGVGQGCDVLLDWHGAY